MFIKKRIFNIFKTPLCVVGTLKETSILKCTVDLDLKELEELFLKIRYVEEIQKREY